MKNKMFAEMVNIPKPPEKINDYTFQITERWGIDRRKSWDKFITDKLYEIYKELGFTQVMLISEDDYKKFLEWALPKYKEFLDNMP